MKIGPWLRLFRLPNLPTAPGDALAGAALLLGAFPETFSDGLVPALTAGGAVFFLYLFGLADNDVVGAKDDAVNAPERPIPSGALSLTAVKAARAVCLVLAFVLGLSVGHLPRFWTLMALMLVVCIFAYNRNKNPLLMGCCRGLSLLAGGGALVPDELTTRVPIVMQPGQPGLTLLVAEGALVLAAVGWALYVAAVTKLSEGEERASEGLGNRRYLLGLAAFSPLAALVPIVVYRLMLPEPRISPILILLPIFGCLWTFTAWCAAVAPLWQAHGPELRRAAVGRTVGALLNLQLGFMLVAPDRAFLLLALALWFAARVIRRLAPGIGGS